MQQEYTNKSGVGVTFVGVFLLYANITSTDYYFCIILLYYATARRSWRSAWASTLVA
jgi:hypothetical protein